MKFFSRSFNFFKVPKSLIILAALLLGIVLIGGHFFTRYQRVAAVQNSLGRSWEITWNVWGKPEKLPQSIDRHIEKHLEKKFGHTRGGTNIDAILLARYRAIFSGPIKVVQIYYFVNFDGQLGQALSKFKHLEHLTLTEDQGRPIPPANVDALFEELAGMERLKILELGDYWIKDSHIERLTSLPDLHTLVLDNCPITGRSADSFKRMSALKKLVITGTELKKEEVDELVRSLPGVTISHDY